MDAIWVHRFIPLGEAMLPLGIPEGMVAGMPESPPIAVPSPGIGMLPAAAGAAADIAAGIAGFAIGFAGIGMGVSDAGAMGLVLPNAIKVPSGENAI